LNDVRHPTAEPARRTHGPIGRIQDLQAIGELPTGCRCAGLEITPGRRSQLAGDDRWASARAVAHRLSPTADPEVIGRELTRLHRLGFIELWFSGGSSYYRLPG
jgi:hypothetical protein